MVSKVVYIKIVDTLDWLICLTQSCRRCWNRGEYTCKTSRFLVLQVVKHEEDPLNFMIKGGKTVLS